MTTIAPDVVRVTTPLPFRPRTVHAYLARLDGGGWMLVDGGANTDEAWAVLESAVLAAAGGWSEVRLHVVTHMHIDHVGLAERVRAAAGAPLVMGRLDAERQAHAAARPEEEAEYRALLLRQAGAPAALVASVERARSTGNALSSFVPADHPLALPDQPLPGAPAWRALWTPGHTAGHLSLFRSTDRLLIAGDAILPRVSATIGVNRQREDPVGDHLDTLRRLHALDARLAAAGHGEPLEPPAARIAELEREARDETQRVAALLEGRAATAWEVTSARYAGRDLPDSMWLQALRETLAHLHHLARTGRAEARGGEAAEVVRFSPV